MSIKDDRLFVNGNSQEQNQISVHANYGFLLSAMTSPEVLSIPSVDSVDITKSVQNELNNFNG